MDVGGQPLASPPVGLRHSWQGREIHWAASVDIGGPNLYQLMRFQLVGLTLKAATAAAGDALGGETEDVPYSRV